MDKFHPYILISVCIGLPPMCLHACYSGVLLYFEMMFSGVHEAIILNSYNIYTRKPKAGGQKTQVSLWTNKTE